MGDKDLTRAMVQMLEQIAEDQRKRDEQMANILQALVPAAGAGAAAAAVATPSTVVTGALPSFAQFDSASELWTDYWCRFKTFFEAHLVSEERQAHVFLTNQSTLVYKMLANLSAQQTPPKEINKLTMGEIEAFMADQFNPQQFVVRERFKFWSKMDRRPGETIPELVARIRGDAGTCNFASIKDPQDEAMRTRFICSINNEAVLKALFRVNDDELTFAKAIEIAQGSEDAAAVAKETVYGAKQKLSPVFQVGWDDEDTAYVNKVGRRQTSLPQNQQGQRKPTSCDRCGRTDHSRDNCRMMDATCFHCQRKGHISAMCRARQRGSPPQPPPIRSQHNAVHHIRTVKVGEASSWIGRIGSEEPATSADERVERVGIIRLVERNKPVQQGGGGASQEGRPSGAVSDWGKNRQPQDSLPHGKRNVPLRRERTAMVKPLGKLRRERTAMVKPHGKLRRERTAMETPREERRTPLKSDRRDMGTQTTHMDRPVMEIPSTQENPVAKEQKTLTPAEGMTKTPTEEVVEGTSNLASRGVPGSTPVVNDERQEVPSEELLAVHRSSTSECEEESNRREAKRRKKGRNRQRRRAKKKEALQKPDDITCYDRDDRDFVGKESSDAEKSPATGMPPIPLADVQAGEGSADSRLPMAAADDVDPRRRGEHAAAVSERSGVVGSAIAAGYRQYNREETADVGKKSVSKDEGDRSSPAQIQERQQCDRGTDEGDGSYKGKFTFPSVHDDVRPPPDRISSVSTFRVAHGAGDEPPPHVSPQADDSEQMLAWQIEWNAAKHRHHDDHRNWFNWDTVEEAILRGPARARRRRELESAEPPDISTLFG